MMSRIRLFMQRAMLSLLSMLLLLVAGFPDAYSYKADDTPQATGIGCYVCTSINGSDKACEDTFENAQKFYREPCYAPYRSPDKSTFRMLPAAKCYKLTAYDKERNYHLVVRDCDAEVARTDSMWTTSTGTVTHCNIFTQIQIGDRKMSGCLATCDKTGCNSAHSIQSNRQLTLLLLLPSLATLPSLTSNFLPSRYFP